jgi:hypothetical protein
MSSELDRPGIGRPQDRPESERPQGHPGDLRVGRFGDRPEEPPEDEAEQGLLSYWKIWILAGIIPVGLLIAFMLAGRGSHKATKTAERSTATEEDNLRDARDVLARDADIASCKAAIGKINNHLNLHPDLRPPAVSGDTLARLGERFGLSPDELTEVESSTYTPLDSRYLDERLLLRDAALALVVKETGLDGRALVPEPVERAAAAFRWVVRQVRPSMQSGQEALPPVFTLRRGWGDPLERALVFLALLEQDAGPERLRGCLLTIPTGDKQTPRLWACGVVVDEGKDVYLFDPRLGMPVPGAGGEGIATLAAVVKDPALLARLDAGPENRYDVKGEQARSAEALAVFSLTGLAPRTAYLQDTLLKNELGARLTADPGDLDRFRDAMKAAGAAGASVWKPGLALLRNFLPVDEGGADAGSPFQLGNLRGFTRPDDPTKVRMSRMRYYEWSLVPWELMPQNFNPNDFPITVGLGQRVRELYAATFLQPIRDPQSSRTLLLRGRYDRAAGILTTEDSGLRDHLNRRRDQNTVLDKQVADWLKDARAAYANQQRAQNSPRPSDAVDAAKRVDALWKAADPVYVLLFGASSGPRDGEVTYQLGLCMQEQAEKYQAGLDLRKRAGIPATPTELDRCRDRWVGAKGWWDRMASDYGQGMAGPPARQNRGRAEAMLGDWEAAAATWDDVSGPMSPLDKLAALYRAREARTHLAAKSKPPA